MNTWSGNCKKTATIRHLNITQGTKKETHQRWVSSRLFRPNSLNAFDNFQNPLGKEPFAVNFHVLVDVFGK